MGKKSKNKSPEQVYDLHIGAEPDEFAKAVARETPKPP